MKIRLLLAKPIVSRFHNLARWYDCVWSRLVLWCIFQVNAEASDDPRELRRRYRPATPRREGAFGFWFFTFRAPLIPEFWKHPGRIKIGGEWYPAFPNKEQEIPR